MITKINNVIPENERPENANTFIGIETENIFSYTLKNVTFELFFQRANLNPNAHLITGLICGYRVEEITDELTQKVRYLDKLVDELAKGKKMEKILRS